MSEAYWMDESSNYDEELTREIIEFRQLLARTPLKNTIGPYRPKPNAYLCGAKGPDGVVCIREAHHPYRGGWMVRRELLHCDKSGQLFTSKSRSGRTPAKFQGLDSPDHTEADYQTWLDPNRGMY